MNWAAGGDNSISGIGNLDLFLNYSGDNFYWSNSLVTGYGILDSSRPNVQFKELVGVGLVVDF